MSGDTNLNRPSRGEQRPERFDLKRHVHESKPFVTGFWMLVSLIVALAALALSVLGGGFLLAGGKVPQVSALLHPPDPFDPGDPGKTTQEIAKSNEEQLNEVVERFASTWNSGWEAEDGWPSQVYASTFTPSSTPLEAKGDHFDSMPDGSIKIRQQRVDGFVLVSNDHAYLDATFLFARAMTAKGWFQDEPSPYEDEAELIVERSVRYAFDLIRTENGWRISRQTWLAKNPARVKDAGDAYADELAVQDMTYFADQRPAFGNASSMISSVASNMSYGYITNDYFFSDTKLTLHDGTTRTLDQMKERLQKFKGKLNQVSITPTLVGIAQTDTNNATAIATYRITFSPTGSATNNVYTATWTERLRFNIGTLRNGWRIAEIERLSSSPILEYYGF